MSVERFHEDEGGYADWLAAHPNGFVFNNFGGSHRVFNVLHRGACSFLLREQDEGRRTRYEKVCSGEIGNLIPVIEQLRAGTEGWKECGRCKPRSVAGGSRKPERPDTKCAPPPSTKIARSAEPAPSRQPPPVADDFLLWRPASEGETLTLEIEPLLASWEARSHASQRRVQAYLDEVGAVLTGHLEEQGARFYLRVEVARQEGTNLLRHYDLENYLTPLAQRLRSPAIVLAMAEKRHRRTASDNSRITLGRVEGGTALEGWSVHATRVAGLLQHRTWKATLRQSLIAAGVQPAAEGPLDVVIAWCCDPRHQAWWNLWKPTGDALGPLFGEPVGTNPFNPADDRVVKLEMHFCPAGGLNNVTGICVWWRPTPES